MNTLYQDPRVGGIIFTRCVECHQLTYDPRTDVCLGLRDCDLCGTQWVCDEQVCPCQGAPNPPWGD